MSASLVPPWFILGTAALVMVLFTVSYIVDLFSSDYTMPPGIYGLVTIVVGTVVGSEAVKGLRK